jgi:hypothetical protein
MDQPELASVATARADDDPFAEARQLAPDARLVLFHDRRHDLQFIMAVPPSSPWWPLLPPEQQAEIRALAPSAEAPA